MRLNTIRRGSGSTIVFIHGIGDSSATWTAVAERLSDRFHTVAVDLLGHGASPHPEDPGQYTRDAALADIDDVLASLDGPVVLVGHSLGGYLTLAHTATRPGAVAGMVVLNSGPGFRDPDKREAWNERSRRNAHRFGVSDMVATLNLQADGVVMDRVAEIDTPLLFLAGGDDRPEYQASGSYLERKMPDARLVIIDGGKHDMHEASHADTVAELIGDFATRCFETASS